MRAIFTLSALFVFCIGAAQTDTLRDKNNPAQQISSPDAGTVDKTPNGQNQPYKIQTEKNAETVQKIKQRTSERKQKNIKKYKGKKSDTTHTAMPQ